jgi:serine/threonine protein kinase
MNTPVTAHSEPQAPLDLVDQRIGKYRVVRKLGEGGMGSVFEAVHVEIGQRAAVKLLKPELSSEPKHVQRFFDEAKLLSMVNHPGLIKIYDFDRTAAGQVYIVMELLEGETLWSRFEKHQQGQPVGMQQEEVARVVRQVASALDAVHQRGIIHRDLKPENIFIVKDSEAAGGERAKILDFGIARLEDPSGEGRRTTAGVAIGTPTYMAPEQCEGSATINDRVDVYALGVMSFELLTGAPPFVSDSMAAVLRMHIVRPPPPLPANIPTELAALITQMLGKEAKERPSMAEVVTRLEGLFGGRASSTALPKLTKRPGMTISPAVIGAVATLLVLGIGGLLLTLLGRKPVTPVAPPKVTSTKAVEPSPPKQDPVVEPAKSREPVEPIKESTTKPVAATGPSGKGTKSRKSDKGDGNVMVFETKKKPKKGNAQ